MTTDILRHENETTPRDRVRPRTIRTPHVLSTLAAFELYASERRLTPATVKRLQAVAIMIDREHPTLATITPDWCQRWIDRLLASGKSPATVKSVHLAFLRLVCKWAFQNAMIETDPAQGVQVHAPVRQRKHDRYWSEDEVRLILSATLRPVATTRFEQDAAAIRWLPWLHAYLGARAGELLKLRGDDVCQVDGMWGIVFRDNETPFRRSRSRFVPLHPQLVEQGFVSFAGKCGSRLLFCPDVDDPAAIDRAVRRIGTKLARKIEEVGVDHGGGAPAHAWRRRFVVAATNAEIAPDVLDHILGRPAAEFRMGGPMQPAYLVAEISKLPRIGVI
ncbi:hypothetical protein [Neoaquamicrobium sediminum]|uniref:hypothetical protein n=1 Tax=Neoaquamicrobium sediminum TaxID=1849104 RepID=UPI003BACE718